MNPLLVLEKPAGFENVKIVADTFASEDMTARSTGSTGKEIYQRLGDCQNNLIKAKKITDAPIHEIVWTEEEAILYKLPMPWHFAEDAGSFFRERDGRKNDR